MLRRRLIAPAVALLLTATGAGAQSPASPASPAPLRDPSARAEALDAFVLTYRFRFDRTHLDDLPHAGTAPTLLETAHGFLVADRLDGGGGFTGERVSLGGQGSSSTQTSWRLDGVDITDPLTGGAPMALPDLGALDALLVSGASLDADTAGPGPVIDLRLTRPQREWTGGAQLTLAPAGLQADPPETPPLSRLLSRTDVSAAAGGTLGASSTGLFIAGRVTASERVDRDDPQVLSGGARAVVATLQGHPGAGHSVRGLLALTSTSQPFVSRARFADRAVEEDGSSLVAHASWDGLRAGTTWVLTAGYQRARSSPDVPPGAAGGLVERLRDGAPLALTGAGAATRHRAFFQASAAPEVGRWLGADHHLRFGVIASREQAAIDHVSSPAFGELLNGVPVRVWDLASSGDRSQYGNTSVHAFVSDDAALGDRVTLSAGLRAEMDRASADGAPENIRWLTASPRVAARWQPAVATDLAFTAGYSWYRHRLPLSVLAYGDPSGLNGTMYRWDDEDGNRQFSAPELTAVARLDMRDAVIDADLRRPTTGEFRIGVEYGLGRWRLGITGLDRRERHLIALVNTGVTAADYTVTTIDDPGVDVAGLQGFRPLPIYNRRPESYGRDAYTLSNTAAPDGRYQGVEISADRAVGDRWFFRFGGTAYRAEGVGAHRGYRADENDQGLPGEAFITPNAGTYARGRLFYDRAYIIKVLGSYAAPWGLRASVVARYQDGQPFTRVVIAEDLNQGAEAIPAYPRGGQRFTYTGTVDVRLEWRRSRVGVFAEAFNLSNMANEMEEDIVTGPAFRTITAVQPPRVVRLGVRIGF